jgi:hypothetical protein
LDAGKKRRGCDGVTADLEEIIESADPVQMQRRNPQVPEPELHSETQGVV